MISDLDVIAYQLLMTVGRYKKILKEYFEKSKDQIL